MLVLPIKKQWFEMIANGEKKEEYREIKSYWTSRFLGKELDFEDLPKECLSQCEPILTVLLKNGYRKNAPTIKCKCKLRIGQGKQEWGAEEEKEYYILTIIEVIEIKNWDDPNPKTKQAMAAAALPATKPITTTEEMKNEITKAINKQLGIGIDILKNENRSGLSRMINFGA